MLSTPVSASHEMTMSLQLWYIHENSKVFQTKIWSVKRNKESKVEIRDGNGVMEANENNGVELRVQGDFL